MGRLETTSFGGQSPKLGMRLSLAFDEDTDADSKDSKDIMMNGVFRDIVQRPIRSPALAQMCSC